MKKKIYAIIDLETTGGMARREKITEIGIVIHDGDKIIDQFQSLINPERVIPPNITKITGISQEMVEDAPKFYEVAKQVVEITQGAIFVAHNVRFDYSFLREEFKRLGFAYTRRQLCTVRLSRKAFPGLPSYSLGNLIRHFDIKVKNRHRAFDDAMATAILLEKILEKENNLEEVNDMINLGVKESQLPANITLEKLHGLPEECGVYYLHDINGDMVYVGKSINIKKRVMEHFSKTTPKSAKLAKSVHDVTFEITGSELAALLLESHEIKFHMPWVNKAQRRKAYQYVIHRYENQPGYICFDVARANKKQKQKLNIIREYPNLAAAKGAINFLVKEYELCQLYCNIEQVSRPCFYYHLKQCFGACIEKELPEDYNKRAALAIEAIHIDFNDNFFVIDRGREKDEQVVVLVEDGIYRGFGYINSEDANYGAEELKESIKQYEHNPDIVRIIRHMLRKDDNLRVISF